MRGGRISSIPIDIIISISTCRSSPIERAHLQCVVTERATKNVSLSLSVVIRLVSSNSSWQKILRAKRRFKTLGIDEPATGTKGTVGNPEAPEGPTRYGTLDNFHESDGKISMGQGQVAFLRHVLFSI